MSDLLPRLKKARTDNTELNKLISDYMPFIKKETAKTPVFQMDYDDRLSIAMLIFMNCVRQYNESAGSFLAFAATCIRNRMIDEGRKLARYHANVIPLYHNEDNNIENPVEVMASKLEYEKEQERASLSEEIDLLSSAMIEFDITFDSLTKICPKQKRSRNQCITLAREIISDITLNEQFIRTRRVPRKELARRFNLSEKTVEKHRRYIVAVTLLLSGDYPEIQAFLPKGGDAE